MRDTPVEALAFDPSVRSNFELGAEYNGSGVNFALFSDNAEGVDLCLFSADGSEETARLSMPHTEGGIWSGYLPGVGPGQVYGYRVHGPFDPENGHRFNANKLLLDPYAKELLGEVQWNDALYGYTIGDDAEDMSFDERDSAPFMPKCVVQDPDFDWESDDALQHDWSDSIIYEAHVRGLTMLHPDIPEEARGTFTGVAHEALIRHLTELGVTAVELLPIHAFVNDRYLAEKDLTNYWGYQSIGFFAPHPRYLTSGRIAEVKRMVKAYHRAGIEVILDVVYNHTAEGNEMGPTLSFRGIDNASYYIAAPDAPRHAFDHTGTGNSLNIKHPMVLRMVLDSLRYWVQAMHVDGFRFDLASTLGREADGFDRNGGFFDAIRQDPVLSRVKLIAEPWDIGEGGYQVGGFPWPFREWNDKFRDDTRSFWRGEGGKVGRMSQRLLGSPTQFDHSHRPATSSVNFLSAHDGFTLWDTVSYNDKHNDANGEDGRDGHSNNLSDNFGIEGPTDDAGVNDARRRRVRAMLTTLMVSQGVPMMLAGDEIGNSQDGNNNAYCQDNETSWIDWANIDHVLLDHAKAAIALRREFYALRRATFRSGADSGTEAISDWRHPEGRAMEDGDWQDEGLRCFAMIAEPAGVMIVLNAGDTCEFTLPEGEWALRHSSDGSDEGASGGVFMVPAQSVCLLIRA